MKHVLSAFLFVSLLLVGCQSDGPVAAGGGSRSTAAGSGGPALHPMQVVTALDKLVARECPDTEASEREAWARHSEWLADVRSRVDGLRADYEQARNTDPSATAPKSFSMFQPYVDLQNKLALEANRFKSMSEALQARHQEAMATIENAR